MAFFHLFKAALQTDGAGAMAATALTDTGGNVPNGVVRRVRYVPDGSTPLANAAAITLAGAVTGATILTSAAVTAGNTAQEWSPQAPGAKASDGTATTFYTDVPVATENINVSIASGGANKKGTLYVWIEG